jgi:uncharacterized protein (DUF58 family)
MNARRGIGLVAAGVVVAAWMVGSTTIAVVAVGLALAAAGAGVWAGLVRRGLTVERTSVGIARVEGEPLRLRVRLRGRTRLASRVEWRDHVGPLGERTAPFDRTGRARLDLERVPRGRYRLGPGRLVVDDPLGITTLEVRGPADVTVLVRPRVPELHSLFTDSGAWGTGGRRSLQRRPSGLEPHSVRAYVEGEPLRAVHWPSSARRGELMVRELEDAPQDGLAVLLDVEAATVTGPAGDTSLDAAVRVAAGLVRAHTLRSRSSMLVIGTPEPEVHRLSSLGRDWEEALDALAAVEPARDAPLRQLVLSRDVLSRVPDLVVVTARPEVVADALAARVSSGLTAALVAIDAPTYAGRGSAAASPALLRLAAAGVALAVVRHGVPVEESLGALRTSAVG